VAAETVHCQPAEVELQATEDMVAAWVEMAFVAEVDTVAAFVVLASVVVALGY